MNLEMGQFSPSTLFELDYKYYLFELYNVSKLLQNLTVIEVQCKTTRERIPSLATL